MVATGTPSDPELISRALGGDAVALDLLVRRHYRAAFSIALAQTGSRADAEDACHDAFLRAAERLADCRDRERFAFWLGAIVRNRARNVVTRGILRRAEPLEPHAVAARDDPAKDAEVADLRRRLESALGVLTATQREVVLLHDLDGWTHADIAATIGTSEGMSRQHLFNARRRLREVLGPNTSMEHAHE
jgi:RNA polymerase sigma-70 factor (ECF subfamily)